MKKVILAGLLLGAAHGMSMPAEAHNVHGNGHHHHSNHGHRAPRHNHCHRHQRLGYGHCHNHTHGGPGQGHHGSKYIHPIPVWYPGSVELHFQF